MDLEDIISLNNGISFNIYNHDSIKYNYRLLSNLLISNIVISNDDLDDLLLSNTDNNENKVNIDNNIDINKDSIFLEDIELIDNITTNSNIKRNKSSFNTLLSNSNKSNLELRDIEEHSINGLNSISVSKNRFIKKTLEHNEENEIDKREIE